jgi:hypothetical protein
MSSPIRSFDAAALSSPIRSFDAAALSSPIINNFVPIREVVTEPSSREEARPV